MKAILKTLFSVLLLALGLVAGSAQVTVDSIVDPETFPVPASVSDSNVRMLSKYGGTWLMVKPSQLQTDVDPSWGVISLDSTGNVTWLGTVKPSNDGEFIAITDFEGDRIFLPTLAKADSAYVSATISNDTITLTNHAGTETIIVLPAASGSGEANVGFNTGGGSEVYKTKTDSALIFRTLDVSGTLINITQTDTTLVFSGVEDDNQTIDSLALNGSVLTISLEGDGEAPITVDLASLTAAGTDNQTVDTLSYAGGIITLTLRDDGEAPYTVDISGVDTDTQLSEEQVEDFVGNMLSGNTETLITVTYQDADGTIDFVVENDLSLYDNSTSDFTTNTILQDTAAAIRGDMVRNFDDLLDVTITTPLDSTLVFYDSLNGIWINGPTIDEIRGSGGGTDDQTLAEVLAQGAIAGTAIDMDGNNINNIGNLTIDATTNDFVLNGNGTTLEVTVAGTERLSLAADGTLQLNNAYTFPTADGTSGQVLKTDGAGALTFQDESGGFSDSLTASTYTDSIYLSTGDSVAIWRVPIFDNGNLSNWRRAVADTVNNRVVNIVIWGDSNTEYQPQAFTIPVRDRLARIIGNAGYGWMNMRADRQDHVDLIATGDWWNSLSTAYGSYALDLFDRLWHAADNDGITYEFTPSSLLAGVDAAKPSAQCSQVQIHYYGATTSAQIAIEVTNENLATTYDTITTSLGYNAYTVDLPEFGYHDVTATCIADSVYMLAINMTTPDTVSGRYGAVIHRVGHSGATAGDFHVLDDTLIAQQLEALDADVVIFNLGTNNFNNPATAKTELDSLINKIRVTNDSIDIVIMSPGESSSSAFSNGQKHDRNYWYLSRKYRGGFLSLFQTLGDYDNAQNDSMFLDNVHYNMRAGELFGDRIVHDLLGIGPRNMPTILDILADSTAAIRADFPSPGGGSGYGIDSTVISATDESVLFVSGTTLEEDADFTFDDDGTTNLLTIGTSGAGNGKIQIYSNNPTNTNPFSINISDSDANWRGINLVNYDDDGVSDPVSVNIQSRKVVNQGRFQVNNFSAFKFESTSDDVFSFDNRVIMDGIKSRNNFRMSMETGTNDGSNYPVIGFWFTSNAGADLMFVGEDGLIGIGSDSATVSLDVGWKTDGIRIPVGTTAQRPTNLNAGLIRYNTDSTCVETYNGSSWSCLGSGGGTDDQTLAEVLTQGNTANTDINMNGFDVTNIRELNISDSAGPSDVSPFTIIKDDTTNDLEFVFDGGDAFAITDGGTVIINGAIEITGTDGTDGQVLTTDGAGNVNFESLPVQYYFGAYSTQDDTLTIDTWTDITFDNEVKKDVSFTHSTVTSSQEITLDSTGTYLLSYTVQWESNATTRIDIYARPQIDGGGGYGDINGGAGYASAGTEPFTIGTTDKHGLTASGVMFTATAGDKVKLQIYGDTFGSGAGTDVQISEGSTISIIRIE